MKSDKQIKILHAHPTAGIFVRQSALSYLEKDMLNYFLTTFISHQDYFLSNFITKFLPSLKRDLSRKKIEEVPFEKLKLYPYKEIIRLFSSRYASPMTTNRIWEWAELSFDKWVASKMLEEINKQNQKKDIHAVHVYEHAALTTLQKAKQNNIFTIFEQPSQHHSFFAPIAKQQLEIYPELISKETNILIDTKYDKYNQRKDKELALADLIICNSSFTKRTLTNANIEGQKIQVIPHGFPKILSQLPKDKKSNTQKPVIFLNAGTQNLRKGVHLLYNAWRKANFSSQEAELWLIGKSSLPPNLTQNLGENVIIKDSIPRDELMALYQEADVFVLPTLADGFAMVISESMSQGVPVITTQNSMAPDFITHQKNGWIIPVGDEEAIVQQMKWCVENKHLLPKIGYEAIQTAKNWQWEDFRNKTANTVKEQILIHHDKQQNK